MASIAIIVTCSVRWESAGNERIVKGSAENPGTNRCYLKREKGCEKAICEDICVDCLQPLVFAEDLNDKTLAHGANPKFIGKTRST
jgi:hypothetical protein